MQENQLINAQAQTTTSTKPEAICLYCPCCSKRLTEMRCKLLCDRCGYYMSCADYY